MPGRKYSFRSRKPALGVGALSGLASTGVQKAMGSGLYLRKGGLVSQVETDGHGLYLKPYKGKSFCQENIILRPNEVKQLTLGVGFMMSDGVVLVSLANSLRKKRCSIQNEVNLEDTINIITAISNNSEKTINIQENELLCFVCYKKL